MSTLRHTSSMAVLHLNDRVSRQERTGRSAVNRKTCTGSLCLSSSCATGSSTSHLYLNNPLLVALSPSFAFSSMALPQTMVRSMSLSPFFSLSERDQSICADTKSSLRKILCPQKNTQRTKSKKIRSVLFRLYAQRCARPCSTQPHSTTELHLMCESPKSLLY